MNHQGCLQCREQPAQMLARVPGWHIVEPCITLKSMPSGLRVRASYVSALQLKEAQETYHDPNRCSICWKQTHVSIELVNTNTVQATPRPVSDNRTGEHQTDRRT